MSSWGTKSSWSLKSSEASTLGTTPKSIWSIRVELMTITPWKSKTPNKNVSFEIIQKVKVKKKITDALKKSTVFSWSPWRPGNEEVKKFNYSSLFGDTSVCWIITVILKYSYLVCVCVCVSWLLFGVLGSELGSSQLLRKHFVHLAIPLSQHLDVLQK